MVSVLDRALRWIPVPNRSHRVGEEERTVHGGIQGPDGDGGVAEVRQRAEDGLLFALALLFNRGRTPNKVSYAQLSRGDQTHGGRVSLSNLVFIEL